MMMGEELRKSRRATPIIKFKMSSLGFHENGQWIVLPITRQTFLGDGAWMHIQWFAVFPFIVKWSLYFDPFITTIITLNFCQPVLDWNRKKGEFITVNNVKNFKNIHRDDVDRSNQNGAAQRKIVCNLCALLLVLICFLFPFLFICTKHGTILCSPATKRRKRKKRGNSHHLLCTSNLS